MEESPQVPHQKLRVPSPKLVGLTSRQEPQASASLLRPRFRPSKSADNIGSGPPGSASTFSDGAQFRVEIPTVNSFQTFASAVDRAEELGLVINRVTETQGTLRYTNEELAAYVALGHEMGIEVVVSLGTRATYDTSASRLCATGADINYRLRGTEQLIQALEETQRAVSLGCRSLVIYDEGLLWILDNMRSKGKLPAKMKFKASAHMGHCNPASIQLLETLGADSINPVRDLQIGTIAALRRAVGVPLDIHTGSHRSSGGFVRTREAAEIVRVASPVYLKVGMADMQAHGQKVGALHGHFMAESASLVRDHVVSLYPQAKQSTTYSDQSASERLAACRR